MSTPNHDEQHMKPRIGSHLREFIFGFNDGLVSTFAVIAGLFGGMVGNDTVFLAALATLVAGAFSMGLGTYLGNKSMYDLYYAELEREKREVKEVPEIETQEIRDIYLAKGFTGELLESVVKHITSDEKLWIETMMREELGFGDPPEKPTKLGITMSSAFVIGSLIPTVPYFFHSAVSDIKLFHISLVASFVGLFLIGWL
ncbi:MAG: VIT1/CCC1 transporter family protein, partial [Patescibacteria group bacterium]